MQNILKRENFDKLVKEMGKDKTKEYILNIFIDNFKSNLHSNNDLKYWDFGLKKIIDHFISNKQKNQNRS